MIDPKELAEKIEMYMRNAKIMGEAAENSDPKIPHVALTSRDLAFYAWGIHAFGEKLLEDFPSLGEIPQTPKT